MKKYIMFFCVIYIFFTVAPLLGCVNDSLKSDLENSIILFNSELEDSIIEINYWLGDSKINISKKEDIKKIYSKLESLNVKEVEMVVVDGFTTRDLVTEDETFTVFLIGDEIRIDGKANDVGEDVQEFILNIALEYR